MRKENRGYRPIFGAYSQLGYYPLYKPAYILPFIANNDYADKELAITLLQIKLYMF